MLTHQIPRKTDRWTTTSPSFTEIDLGAHSGDCANGEFAHTLNVTDIHTTWVESRAVLGKSQLRVQQALDKVRQALPFRLQGIDSDKGAEFINAHLHRDCRTSRVQVCPYKKDDHAHIEQKNWTHVRTLLGDVRDDSEAAVAAINALYDELRLLQNLFLPSVKLMEKHRVGARVRRRDDGPRTPFERCRRAPRRTRPRSTGSPACGPTSIPLRSPRASTRRSSASIASPITGYDRAWRVWTLPAL